MSKVLARLLLPCDPASGSDPSSMPCSGPYHCFLPGHKLLLCMAPAAVQDGGMLHRVISKRGLSDLRLCAGVGLPTCQQEESKCSAETYEKRISALQKESDRHKVEHLCEQLQLSDVKEYTMGITAFGRSDDWQRMLTLIDEMLASRTKPDTIVFNGAITACEQGGQWEAALLLLEEMRALSMTPNMVSFEKAISVCKKGKQWPLTILLLEKMGSARATPKVKTFNAALSACENGEQWQHALLLLDHMRQARVMPNMLSFNTTIMTCSNSGQWQRTLLLLEEMRAARISPHVDCIHAAISACEKAGQWDLKFGDHIKHFEQGRLLKTLTAMTSPKSFRDFSTLVSGPGDRVLFGNYAEYYEDRITDTRIQAVKKWFASQEWCLHKKSNSANISADPAANDVTALDYHAISQETPFNHWHILDIGCNSGQVSAEIARTAEPHGLVLGIDVDTELIAKARERHASNNLRFANLNVLNLTKGFDMLGNMFDGFSISTPTGLTGSRDASASLPNNCSRVEGTDKNTSFQLIFVLSVTKWIHFQYGDKGIQALFEVVYNLLSEEQPSYFVLEPQSWREYKRQRQRSQEIDAMVATIKMRPSAFSKWLTKKIEQESESPQEELLERENRTDIRDTAAHVFSANGGFDLVHTIHASDLQGYDRDLFIFRKRPARLKTKGII